jgi:hypothetical protein
VSEHDQTAGAHEAPAPLSAEAVTALTDAMRRGRTADAETQIMALAAQGNGGGREAVLAALVAEPEVHRALVALEQWLDGTVDAPSAAPLGAWWALPAAHLDLPTVASDARLYIDAYPNEGRVIGNLEERAADWLVRRIAMSFDASAQLPAMREAITMLAGAARPAFPATSASLDAVVADVDDATLWNSLVRQIVHAEMERTP